MITHTSQGLHILKNLMKTYLHESLRFAFVENILFSYILRFIGIMKKYSNSENI